MLWACAVSRYIWLMASHSWRFAGSLAKMHTFSFDLLLISLRSLSRVSSVKERKARWKRSAAVWSGSSSSRGGDECREAVTQPRGRGQRRDEWSTMKGGFQGNWATTHSLYVGVHVSLQVKHCWFITHSFCPVATTERRETNSLERRRRNLPLLPCS